MESSISTVSGKESQKVDQQDVVHEVAMEAFNLSLNVIGESPIEKRRVIGAKYRASKFQKI